MLKTPNTVNMNTDILCRLHGRKTVIFGSFSNLGSAIYPAPSTNKDQIRFATVEPQSTLTRRILSRSVYYVHLGGKNHQILPVFELLHFVMSPISGVRRKLNAGAQLQTFPYPTVLRPFLYSSRLMAKSYAETPSF